MTSIMLSTCPRPNTPWSEMVYDSHTHSFSSLVTKARNIANLQDLPMPYEPNPAICRPGSASFIVDMGIIPPLCYTAIKCRVPSTRRQAIDVLTTSPHREAMWDGAIVAAIAEQVIALEEGDFFRKDSSSSLPPVLTRGGKPQPSSQSWGSGSSSLPEAYRFEDVQVIMQDGTRNKGRIICRRRRRHSGEATNPSLSSSGLNRLDYSTANADDAWEVIEDSFHCETSNVR
ncbi:hypothetical protein M432DRAFT_23701 [Thermoascus aurantiacus ATCC 26904]